MAGHSKWANIKYRKSRADEKKVRIFSSIMKEVISAVKQFGSDPRSNYKLRVAIEKARSYNIPKDSVERNIKKFDGVNKDAFQEVTYEAYGFDGVGIVCVGLTDNKNRSSGEFRNVISNMGCSVAVAGCVSFNFERKGLVCFVGSSGFEQDIIDVTCTYGIEDFSIEDNGFEVLLDIKKIDAFVKYLISKGGREVVGCPVLYPMHWIKECSHESMKGNMELIQSLEELQDIDCVYHNLFIS